MLPASQWPLSNRFFESNYHLEDQVHVNYTFGKSGIQ